MSNRHPSGGYLTRLTLALAAGASALPSEIRQPHFDFLRRCQSDTGGWAGREGAPDPYYTAFALRGLWITGGLDADVATRAAEFLRSQLTTRQTVVDLMSLIFAAAIVELAAGVVVIGDDADWRGNVAEVLATLRTSDGGFAKTPEGRAGSTYQTFLSTLCHELLEIDLPDPLSVAEFLAGQRQSDGGYLEIRAAKRAGVNPTAAAIGTLRCIDRLSSQDAVAAIQFLSERQNPDGGFSANTRIPFSDVLSSFTALWTMVDIADQDPAAAEWVRHVNADSARRYAESMSRREGGFVGFELDDTVDVEYTFYGLGVLAVTSIMRSNHE